MTCGASISHPFFKKLMIGGPNQLLLHSTYHHENMVDQKHSATPSIFWTLPQELRDIIYAEAFTRTVNVNAGRPYYCACDIPRCSIREHCPNYCPVDDLMVSKRYYAEAQRMFFRCTTFLLRSAATLHLDNVHAVDQHALICPTLGLHGGQYRRP